MDGRAGALYCIWWGEVSDDSDGPLEWCRPVPTDQAQQLAIQVPELVLRDEPAHREAFIHLGRHGQIEPAQWPLPPRPPRPDRTGAVAAHHPVAAQLGPRAQGAAE
jgi:hypothetical protein